MGGDPPLSWPRLNLTPWHTVLQVYTHLEVLAFRTLTYGFRRWHNLAYNIYREWDLGVALKIDFWIKAVESPCDRQQDEKLRRCLRYIQKGMSWVVNPNFNYPQ